MDKYLDSEFYKKYKDTYHSDKILKEVFNQDIGRIHSLKNAS